MRNEQSISILKGNILYSKSPDRLEIQENSYLVCHGNIIQGVFPQLPEPYAKLPVTDYEDRLIIPGLTDLHIHAPQYAFRGLGMDMELLEWLETNTFPEEAKYQDLNYARSAYTIFVDQLCKSPTTRACVFATVHRESTLLLMDLLEQAGLGTMVGKVNMDRNCPDYLREDTRESWQETDAWIKDVLQKQYQRTQAILTPRFIPSCTDELMEAIKNLQVQYQLPVQSHLSENYGEIQWVKELCPDSEFYGDAYDHFGLFGAGCKTVMAHCVHSGKDEIRRLKANGVFVAHCPESNMNLSSGVAPIRTYLDEGLSVGLGSDVAGGTTENLFTAMTHAVQASKLRWRLKDDSLKPLTIPEVFYLATKGGGAFFGKVGSFEPGYEMDVLVLDDGRLKHPQSLTIQQRLERMIYASDDREIYAKYVGGKQLF